jgi:hypothetical protein
MMAKKIKKEIKNDELKYCHKYGLEIKEGCVTNESLDLLFKKKGKEWTEMFSKFFGIQTIGPYGCFSTDIESVLIRLEENGRLTGTQLFPD